MLQRHLITKLRAALRDTPVVLVHGPRQTGKSTLTRAIAEHAPARRYLTLDDATVLAAASADPDGFIAGLQGPVVLDEVQRAPGLFPAIKAEVDRRRTPGRFLLTGSANVLLLPKISESLAGRIEILTLWPFSQGEIEERPESFIDDLFRGRPIRSTAGLGKGSALLDRVVRGGFPEPVARRAVDRRSAWFASYLTTILQRDIRDVSNIDGLTEVPRLLALVASRAGGLLNFADISRGLAVPQTTLKRYFALLESVFLVRPMPAWSSNLGLRLTKSPKVFLSDTGLACHLLGVDRGRLAADGAVRGALIENFVAMELMKQAGWSVAQPSLFHMRTVSGVEVDLVLEDRAGRIVGIEVKSAASVAAKDFKGLRALREAAGDRFVKGVVLHGGGEVVTFEDRMVAAPISALWSSGE